MPSQTHRRRNKNRRQQRNSRNRARSSKLSLAKSEYGLGLAGSIVGVSALSQGSELLNQHNNEDPSQQQMFIGEQGGGKGRGSDSAEYILRFLEMLNTVKLYHWKTHSYATHKATDQLYTSLNGKIDEFVEVMLGKTTIVSESDITRAGILNQPALHFVSYKDNADFRNQIEYYKKFLINLSSLPGLNGAANTDLFAIRDEMLALLNQFLYLLTLK